MNDNKTAHMALEYDEKIRATIPNYDLFHSETIDLVKRINPTPQKWLDTGCGTGTFAVDAMKAFKSTKFVLADPSAEMMDIAMKKIDKTDSMKMESLGILSTEEIELPDESFDVITAIQAHHYLQQEGRKAATKNCFRLLKPGGIYITFENIRPLSEAGLKIGLERWKQFQILQGKSDEEAHKHIYRLDKEYFPITIEEHLELLRTAGFSTVEVFWASYMQAGFYGMKE
ncbi:MAG: methyltransferase domain-containing protein [Clostridia bacterium]|nr:methyltransferase domain-containing protein [Clostridia bacterium]